MRTAYFCVKGRCVKRIGVCFFFLVKLHRSFKESDIQMCNLKTQHKHRSKQMESVLGIHVSARWYTRNMIAYPWCHVRCILCEVKHYGNSIKHFAFSSLILRIFICKMFKQDQTCNMRTVCNVSRHIIDLKCLNHFQNMF